MNKIILDKLKAEYETTALSLDEIATKYNVDVKDMKGSNKWKKNLLEPKTKSEKKAHLPTHIDIVSQVEVVENNNLLLKSNPDPESNMEDKVAVELTDTLATELIVKAGVDTLAGKVPELPKELKDGFDGLRKLDIALQRQAQTLISTIDSHLSAIEVGDTRALRDLAVIHTSIRDSYFNSKNTMVSIINGDVTQNNNTMNNLAGFLAEVESDC